MAGTRRAGDREGWPNLPDEEISSLAKYLSDHSAADIIRRFHKSAQEFIDDACLRTESSYKFGNCEHSLAGMFILIGSLAIFFYRHRHLTKRINVQATIFVTSFFGFYVLLSLWYFPMVAGPRVMFALLLPLFWTVGLVERYTEVHKQKLVVFGHAIGPLPFLYSLLILVAVYQVFELAAYRAAQLYGGA